jgi:hypothetical protein
MQRTLTFAALSISIIPIAGAQAPGTTQLTYVANSTTKLEQVIGDCDDQAQAIQIVNGQPVTCQRTVSQSLTRYNVAGNGQGGSFEANNGRMIFFFGDTISGDGPPKIRFNAADPIAWSTSTDPEQGLLLTFYSNPDGTVLFVQPPGVDMGGNNIPNSGIDLNGQIYFIVNTGSDTTNVLATYTLLAGFNEAAQTFSTGRLISPPGGRFIQTSMHADVSGANVFIYGAGPYRQSDIYLQMVPAANFTTGTGTQYFTGLVNGQPTWSSFESDAVPVVQDNPLNGPPWPNDNPTVGNMSVVYSKSLSLWFMTYDGGRQPITGNTRIRGTYFTYAPQPWGPWAPPQLIFDDIRDKAYGLGGYVHNPTVVPDPPGDGLNGPTIGTNDIYLTPGGSFAPQMIERFITVTASTLKLYYNVSTWNPYTVVRMRSTFNISTVPVTQPAPAISLSASHLEFYSYQTGGANPPAAQSVAITNIGGGSPTFSVSADQPWVTASLEGATFTVSVNPTGIAVGAHTSTISVASPGATNTPQTVTVTLNVSAAAAPSTPSATQFIPITPCRIADTRTASGPFGGPTFAGQTARDFAIPASACGIPLSATAYSLNVAVVPTGQLGYLTLWPTGQQQPSVATLNSDGRIKSNAAIVPAGVNGSISAFVTDATDVVIDVNGYFVPIATAGAQAFYPLTPCRIADTRNPNATLGGPSLAAAGTRAFPILSSNCGIPATAQAYSLNLAAVPKGPLGYLTAWPAGQAQPSVASLNAPTGTVVANAAIVPAGVNGGIDIYSTDPTDLVIDINGYFAPPGAPGALSFYASAPCRVLDSRLPAGTPPFSTIKNVNVVSSGCGVPATAEAYVFNATAVPPGPLGYLTMWPLGQMQPQVSTLNALDGAVTSNLAIVPGAGGSISVFPFNPTQLVLDLFGYFAP